MGAASAATLAPNAPAIVVETPAAKATRFTTVSESELRHGGLQRDADQTNRWQWLAVGGLLALAVIGLGAGVYLATRAPSADQLYGRIKAAAGSGEGLTAAKSDIDQFLEAFPGDPRTEEIRGLQDELALESLERRFELHARRARGVEDLLPIERAYLEAVQIRASDPEAALARLEALVAVFGGAPDASLTVLQRRASERCLELAKTQVSQLSATVKKFNQEQRLAIRKQLERADKLAESDRPAAEQVWRGIVTLYTGKGWAKDLVEQAQTALATAESEASVGSPR
jgi:eukaryotic-like serine/threonine-protein kinase